jgi:putative transposase
MPNYIRARVSGGTFFFTVTLADRSSNLLIERVDDLRASFALVQRDMPFQCDAMVVLPDHLHAVWTLPDGDDDFSTRWKRIKAGFSKSVGIKAPRSKSQASRGEVGIWQRRFWEHCIRDDKDYENHMRYCAWNPVKHGYVETPEAWQFSSIHRDARKGNVWWT